MIDLNLAGRQDEPPPVYSAFGYDGAGPRGTRRRLDDSARDELRDRAADIMQSFLGEPNRRQSNRRQLRWGRNGSVKLDVAGSQKGLWFDYENGVGGDQIKFLMVQLGCSAGDAIAYAFENYLGPSWSACAATARPIEPEPDDAKRIERAFDIWSEVQPICGTLAELYLNNRGIYVPDEALSVLGLHRHCPFEGRRAPAMVALITDIVTGEPLAIHRRELTQDATAAGAPMSLGPKSGGAITLARPCDGELAIGEGVETCLSGMQLGYGPAWSAIDAGGVKNFPVLDYVDRLTILVDNDISGTGLSAAAECRMRWERAGKQVRCVMPKTPGWDFNDVLCAELAGSPQHA